MSFVRKCDICGKIYNDYPEASETYMEIATITGSKDSRTMFGRNEMDCCPKCSCDISNFIDTLKTYPGRVCITILDEAL